MAVTDPLVSTAWLADRLGSPNLAIIDASWFMPGQGRDPAAEHARGHIPGAVFFDIDEISDRSSPLPHMLSAPADFATAVRRLGVGRSSTVVVYDYSGLFSAPRVWWNFRAMGHEEVFVLDGGLRRWTAEGRPLESGWRTAVHGDFKSRPETGLVAALPAVAAALANDRGQVVDARAHERFTGSAPEPRPGLKPGHMPGARNVPWSALVDDEGRLAGPEALRSVFEAAGVDLAAPIITTCGSGVSAALLALALARLGRPDAAVYDGSWSEWGARADTAVVTGEA